MEWKLINYDLNLRMLVRLEVFMLSWLLWSGSFTVAPLNEHIKKNVKFEFGQAQECAFNDLKNKLCNAPLLTLPNFELTFEFNFEIECDASGKGSGAILM